MEKLAMRFLNLYGNNFLAALFRGYSVRLSNRITTIAANRAYFGDFDPFGDFDLIFGA
jgi:hypothetical protein